VTGVATLDAFGRNIIFDSPAAGASNSVLLGAGVLIKADPPTNVPTGLQLDRSTALSIPSPNSAEFNSTSFGSAAGSSVTPAIAPASLPMTDTTQRYVTTYLRQDELLQQFAPKRTSAAANVVSEFATSTSAATASPSDDNEVIVDVDADQGF
jgi:hypothetical protein